MPLRSTPHDMHDYDGISEIILVDRPVNKQMRKLLVHLDRARRDGDGVTSLVLEGEKRSGASAVRHSLR